VNGQKVGRLSRALDLASLVLILIGGVLYVRAFLGMQQIRKRGLTEFVRGSTEVYESINEHARLSRISTIGLVIAGAGLFVGLSAAAHARIIAGRAPKTENREW
jgi:hypothetical protein